MRKKKNVLKFRDLLFLRILQEAANSKQVLAMGHAATLYNETIKRLKIPLSKADTIRSNSTINETKKHLREIGVIDASGKMRVNHTRCVELWAHLEKHRGINYSNWQTWPAEIERPTF